LKLTYLVREQVFLHN